MKHSAIGDEKILTVYILLLFPRVVKKWGYLDKKHDSCNTNGIITIVLIWWSVRNHRRTLRQIRALRVKVVIHFVQHDVIDLNGLSAAVENQSEFVIIEIDFIQKDVDDGTTVKRIIKVALLKNGEEVCDFLC